MSAKSVPHPGVRRVAVTALAEYPDRIDVRSPTEFAEDVICGLPGTGKSRLLAALAAVGAQTLDLEGIARHRGSLLGDLPGEPQPSQKSFETQLVDALGRLDPSRPVYVESESRRIG